MMENIPELLGIIKGNKSNAYIVMARMRCSECGKGRLVRLQSIKQNIKRNKYTGLCGKCSYKHRVGRLMPSTPRQTQSAGYILVRLQPDDFFFPMANNGYVREHRLVMAKSLGRCLQSWEQVHHKGIRYSDIRNRSDNLEDNLELTTNGSHHIEHQKGYKAGFQKGYEEGKRKAQLDQDKQEIKELIDWVNKNMWKQGSIERWQTKVKEYLK